MISANQLTINGGNFTQNNYSPEHNNILKHVAFQSLPRSRDAAYSAAINLENHSRGPCTKGTRVHVISHIMAWANERDPTKVPPVYWLTGLAGLGKTTIAYSICELLNESRLPFASFFCSLQLDSRNSKLLVTTLCRDLAELYNTYAAHVLPILESNSKVVDAGLPIQIDELLSKPWEASSARRTDLLPPIIVVDALDESDRGPQFLEEVLRVIHVGKLAGIKFLVTSRPNPKIVDLCKSFPPDATCRLHEIDTADVQGDIEKYLQEALPELKDEPEFPLLSQRAGGWFIYATTAVRFIHPPHSPPAVSEMRSHLQALVNHGSLTSDGDRSLLDSLYARILADAFRDSRVRATRLRIVHTIVCAESPMDISVLSDINNADQDTVARVVESLHAVVFVSQDGCVYWYHASFPDFVLTRARSRTLDRNYPTDKIDLFCDGPAHHRVVTRRCFSVMQESLHFNMCHIPSSYVFDCDVPGLKSSIEKVFSPTLRYVSRHWARHLLQTVPAENDDDELFCALKDFLDNKLLFWIEAMNLMDPKTECSALLKEAETWLTGGKEWPDLRAHLADAGSFSAFFAGSPSSRSTPQLYISALSMWNQDSPIWRTWRHRFAFVPSISLPSVPVTIPLLTISTSRSITSVAFSPDGKCIVSGSDDKSVRMWDAMTGKQLRELRGHDGRVTSVALSPDGDRLISGSDDKSVRVWDKKTGKQLRELRGHIHSVTSIAFSPDGGRLISGSDDKSVRMWDAKTGELLRDLRGHIHSVTSITFSPDGGRLISSSHDKSVRVWDAKTGELLRELRGHTDSVISIAFSPDGKCIVSGSDDKSVRVWDAKTGELLRELRGHDGWVTSVAFSPDGDQIASGSTGHQKSLLMWDAKTGKQLRELRGHTNHVTSVVFSPTGDRIVSASKDHSVRVWDAKTHKQLREPPGDTDIVPSVALFPDRNQVVSGFLEYLVRMWDAKTGKQPRGLQGHTDWVTSVAFSPVGDRLVSGSADKSVRVWDAKTGKQLGESRGHDGWVNSVAFSPDGNQTISGSNDKSVRIWDAKSGKQLRILRGHIDSVTSVAFFPDGNRLVSGSDDNSVRIWDAKTGKQLRVLRWHTDSVTSIAFSPDGNRLICGSADELVVEWDARTGEQLRELRGHTDSVTSVAFSPDGYRFISGSDDDSVRVWDAKTGEPLRELRGHFDSVTSVAFSPDGNLIVSASLDKSVRVWDAKTGELLRELRGHTDHVTSVVFSPEGDRVISGSDDHSVRLWTNLIIDPPWILQDDGWIISDAERLAWVPSTIGNILLSPHNSVIISGDGSATISFNECYTDQQTQPTR